MAQYYPDEASMGVLRSVYISQEPHIATDPSLGGTMAMVVRNARAHMSTKVRQMLPKIYPAERIDDDGKPTVHHGTYMCMD